MITIPKGTLLFRGIDCPPQQVSPVLRLNSEGILWTALTSTVAQTYIPITHGRTRVTVPTCSWELDQGPRPDDGIIDSLVRACGGAFNVNEREHKLKPGDNPDDPRRPIPKSRIVNGTWGRATQWSYQKRITWHQIIAHLNRLGYQQEDRHFTVKTRYINGSDTVLPSKFRMKGSLAIFRTTAELRGCDRSTGESDCLDPQYHHAAGWAEAATQKGYDFVQIDDLAQTEVWGNVGHRSIAITPIGLPKLEIAALIPAFHREWGTQLRDTPTVEERAWRRGLIKNQTPQPCGEQTVLSHA